MQKFSVILVHLPPLVVEIIVADQLSDLEKQRETLENDYKVMVQELERRKVQYKQVKFLTVHREKLYGRRELPMKYKCGVLSRAPHIFSPGVSNEKTPGSERNKRKVWAAIFNDVIEGVIDLKILITEIFNSTSVGKNSNDFLVKRKETFT